MFTRTTAILRGYKIKYPELVSYNKVPWLCLAPDSPELHATVTPHYAQLLSLAASVDVPHLLQPQHMNIPVEKHLHVLPNSLYIIPVSIDNNNNNNVDGKKREASEGVPDDYVSVFAPYGWSYESLVDSASLQYYGPVEKAVRRSRDSYDVGSSDYEERKRDHDMCYYSKAFISAERPPSATGNACTYLRSPERIFKNSGLKIKKVVTFKSDDLRLVCNGVFIKSTSGNVAVCKQSSLGRLAALSRAHNAGKTLQNVNSNNNHDDSTNGTVLPDFAIFHFYRPNRPPAEVTKPLERLYRFSTAPCGLEATSPSLGISDGNNNNNNNTSNILRGLPSTSSSETHSHIDFLKFTSSAWTPVLDDTVSRRRNISDVTALRSEVTPMPLFKPPVSYLPGLAERLALKPGNCFGRRDRMWGNYF